MPESISDLVRELTTNGEWQAILLVATAAFVGLFYVLRNAIRHWRNERAARRILRRLGSSALRDIQLPDGTGGEVTIEHLLLGREALVIVNIMRFDGLIFGGKLTDQWTQVLGRRSFKFDNPNHYLQRQVNAVHAIVPGTQVTGHLLFTNARFPKDMPDGVLLPASLHDLPPRPRRADISRTLRQAWKTVRAGVS